jgi:hypothetical protein
MLILLPALYKYGPGPGNASGCFVHEKHNNPDYRDLLGGGDTTKNAVSRWNLRLIHSRRIGKQVI